MDLPDWDTALALDSEDVLDLSSQENSNMDLPDWDTALALDSEDFLDLGSEENSDMDLPDSDTALALDSEDDLDLSSQENSNMDLPDSDTALALDSEDVLDLSSQENCNMDLPDSDTALALDSEDVLDLSSQEDGDPWICKEKLSELLRLVAPRTQNITALVKNLALSSESRRVVEEAANYLTDTLRKEYLVLLLTEDAIWKALVEEVGLSREEEAAICDILKNHVGPQANKEKTSLQKELQDRKRFLEAFPHLEKKLREYITQLREIADHISQDIAITNVVTDSTSVVLGIVSIAAVLFAILTGGGSVVVLAAVLSVGAAVTVTRTKNKVVEEASRMSDMAKASSLVSNARGIIKEITQIMPTVKITNTTRDLIPTLKSIAQRIRAFKMAKGNPNLIANPKNFTTTGTLSAQRAREVKDAFGAQFRAPGITSIFVALNNLVKASIRLGEGPKTELADKLREIAWKLEAKLKELVQIHRTLQSKLPK